MDDITMTDGKAELAYLDYATPWHGKGTPMPERGPDEAPYTVKEYAGAAGLDWRVSKLQTFVNADLVVPTNGPLTIPTPIVVPGSYAIVRDDNLAVLGVVGEDYVPYQHLDMFETISKFGNFDVIGSLGGGDVVFGLIKLEGLETGGESFDHWLVAYTGHTGNTAVGFAETIIRVVCRNTLDMALAGAGANQWKARHNEGLMERLSHIEADLDDVFSGERLAKIGREIDRLMNTPISDGKVESVLDETFPSDKAISEKAWAVRGIYEQHPTVAEVKGSQWGLYQSVSFFDQWTSAVKGDRLERQAYATLNDNPTPNARKALALMKA